jgi:hypothetical protein
MAFLAGANSAELRVRVLSLGEPRKSVEVKRRADPAAAAQLGVWVDRIETTSADRILDIDTATARLWGELSAARSLPVVDTLGDGDPPRSDRRDPQRSRFHGVRCRDVPSVGPGVGGVRPTATGGGTPSEHSIGCGKYISF